MENNQIKQAFAERRPGLFAFLLTTVGILAIYIFMYILLFKIENFPLTFDMPLDYIVPGVCLGSAALAVYVITSICSSQKYEIPTSV